MELLKKHRVLFLALGAAIVIGGLYFIFDKNSQFQKQSDTNADGQTGQTIDLGNGLGITTSGGAVIKEVGTESAVPVPSLNRTVTFSGSMLPVDAQPAVRERINEDIAALKKDSSNLSLWLALGLELKQAGDYRGAEEMWVYVNTVADKDETSALNLGDLYMNFLKNYPKAETYLKKALSIKPDDIQTYNNLFLLYKYLYKTDTSAAADIKAQALKTFPGQSAFIGTWQ